MNVLATLRRTAAAILAIAFAALLSGCVLSSEEALIPADEAVEFLPASFVFATYKEAGDGFAISVEKPASFSQVAGTNTYADVAGELLVYFVPRPDGSHLINIAGTGADKGVMYGIARYKDGILELRMVFSGEPGAELQAAGVAVPAGATIKEGGVLVSDRAALEAMLDLIAKGTVTTTPMITWAGEAAAPATIVKDGDWYKAG